MIEFLTIAATVGVSTLLLGVGYAVGRQSTRPTVQLVAKVDSLDVPWRAPREGGYRGQGGAIPTSPPPGKSATSRGRYKLPPPNLDLIDTSVPGGREVKRSMEKALALDEARQRRNAERAARLRAQGDTPPPPRGGSGQATARDEWHDWGSSGLV